MKWLNTNSHRVYVDDPENESGRAQTDGLLLISKDEEVKAEKGGALAQRLDDCPGLVHSDTDVAKAHDPEGRDAALAGPGPEAFPAETDEIDGPTSVRGDSGGEGGSFESRTVKELRAEAKQRGIEVPAKARKPDLIAALRA